MNRSIRQFLAKIILGNSLMDFPTLNSLLLATENIERSNQSRLQEGKIVFTRNCFKNAAPNNWFKLWCRFRPNLRSRKLLGARKILIKSSAVESFTNQNCIAHIIIPGKETIKLAPDFVVNMKHQLTVLLQIGSLEGIYIKGMHLEELQKWLIGMGYLYLVVHPSQLSRYQ